MRGTKVSNHLHCRPTTVVDGSHNVSRWMTWLPISLKNAAKCDKWYQLQNLSITESLNANGAWKKTPVVQLQACHVLSVEQKPIKYNQILCLVCAVRTRRCSGSFCARLCERDNGANRSWQLCLIRHSHCRSLLHVSGIRAPKEQALQIQPLVCVCAAHTHTRVQKTSGIFKQFSRFFVVGEQVSKTSASAAKVTLLSNWFTDLSVAGLPAELKHIIQRRKRKQP